MSAELATLFAAVCYLLGMITAGWLVKDFRKAARKELDNIFEDEDK